MFNIPKIINKTLSVRLSLMVVLAMTLLLMSSLVFMLHYSRKAVKEEALQKANTCWEYIKQHLIDYDNGEWFWSRRKDGTLNMDDDHAGFWKCPYHNSRMCLEVIERFA